VGTSLAKQVLVVLLMMMMMVSLLGYLPRIIEKKQAVSPFPRHSLCNTHKLSVIYAGFGQSLFATLKKWKINI
jgi:hypothetical protein